MKTFAGKTALVTGGGSGIGRSLVLALARHAARVVVADIRAESAGNVADEVRALGGSAIGVQCDIGDQNAIARLKETANAAYGPVSMLFANAGVAAIDRLTDVSDKDMDWVIHVNFIGTTRCIKAFLPDMLAAREGHIVATASAAGLLPSWLPMHSLYTAGKAGLIGLILNLRNELAESNIGASVLCPFAVTTNMQRDNLSYRPDRFGGPGHAPVKLPGNFYDEAALASRSPEEVAEMVLRAVRENRPMVVTDPAQRDNFRKGYADLVMQAFDDVEAFDSDTSRR
jgi:NAD(P)-dependent dehydrogenase (short-subunit alcohol dehydrogenase family)